LNHKYNTILHAASAEDQKKIVQMLLNKEADVNMQDEEYINALQATSQEDHSEVI